MHKTSQASFVMLAVGGLVAAGVAYYANRELSKQPDMNRLIADLAREVNKDYPTMIDSKTRIDKIIPGTDNSFSYRLTVTEDIAASDLDLAKIQENIKSNYCTTPELKTFRDAATRITWIYYNRAGQYMAEVAMTPDRCK